MTVQDTSKDHKKHTKRAQASNKHSFGNSGRSMMTQELPKYEMPQNSTDPASVYQIIHDELALDCNPTLNLATFVTNWMDKEANQLLLETAPKNYADMSCYTQTLEIEERCVSILADLWNAPEKNSHSTGTYCVGSSEACLLGALAMKKTWQQRRKAANKDHYHPNIVMSSTVQVVWKKFAAYWDVEPRYAIISEHKFDGNNDELIKLCDENTIGVISLLGSTYTGHFDDVQDLNTKLNALNKAKGWEIGIHVDAATGGFIAPFLYPDLKWDFRLNNVLSINASGHKYGLTYPGSGWIVWRDHLQLPEELVFDLHYLGGTEKTYTLNFSKPASQAILQYYNFLRLGRDGYTRVIQDCRDNADYLTTRIEKLGIFDIVSSATGTPLVTAKLKDSVTEFTVFDLEHKLKEYGWIVPAYQLAEGAEHLFILRMVVREAFSADLAAKLVEALKESIAHLSKAANESTTTKKKNVESVKKAKKTRNAKMHIPC